MNTTIKFSQLPDSRKPEAAKAMLAGARDWMFFGDLVEHPGADELRRWAGLAPQSPQAGAEGADGGSAPHRPLSDAHPHTRDDRPMTRQQKREAVDLALSSIVNLSDRELARRLGVSHTFIALRRRKGGNVAVADVGKCRDFSDQNARAREGMMSGLPTPSVTTPQRESTLNGPPEGGISELHPFTIGQCEGANTI